jgi:hypothetical protein
LSIKASYPMLRSARLVLLVYTFAALLVLGITHRFVLPFSPRAAALLFFLPFLLVGHALIANRVYAPIDKTYLDVPLSELKERYAIGAPHNPATADIVSQMIPWRHAVREAYSRGEWPLWNPYILSGDILAAAAQPAPYSPFTLLALLLPVPVSFTFTAAITLFVAATGTFLFARELGCRELAASFGAAGFALSSAIALYSLWPLGLTWSLLPSVLLGAHRIVHQPSARSWTLLTTALVLLLFAGHPESVLHVVVIGVLYALVHIPRPRAIGFAVVAGVAALLLCAVYLLPYLEAIPQTAEYAFRQTWKNVDWSRDTPRVLLVLATDVFPSLHLRRWINPELGGLHGETAAVGSMVLALAIYAAWRVRSSATWFFAALALICLLTHAHWGPVTRLIHALPLFEITINDRLSFAAAFALALLAALGAEEIAGRGDRRAAGLTLAIVLVALAGGTLWISRNLVIEAGPRDWGEHRVLAELAGLTVSLALLAFLPMRAALPALLAVLFVQRVLTEGGVHKSFPREAAYPEMEIFAPMKKVREPFRVAGTGWALLPGTNTLYGLEDARGYEAMTFMPYVNTYPLWCVPQVVFFNRIDDLSKPFLSLLNVRFAFTTVSAPLPPGWSVVARQGDAVLLENASVLPRAFVPQYVTLGLQSDIALAQMAQASDFRQRAWISADVVPYDRANGPGRASVRRTYGGYTIDAEMKGDGWIVITNSAWKGWRAYVDGKRIRMQRANVAFLSVHVSPGKHRIRIVYRPESFVIGRTISLATLSTCVVTLFTVRWRRKKAESSVAGGPTPG